MFWRNRDNPTRYQLIQRLIAFGDDFFIEDENGEKVFHVDGKLLAVRETLHVKDMEGNTLAKIQQRLLRIRETMEIEGPNDETLAILKKAMFTVFTDKWDVSIPDGADLEIQGNILDLEYTIERRGKKVAEVSKAWFSLRDSYGVEIEPGEDDPLILAIVVGIDMMSEENRPARQDD